MKRVIEGAGHEVIEAEWSVLLNLLSEEEGQGRCHGGGILGGLMGWGEIDD
jgi:hypothetical protein